MIQTILGSKGRMGQIFHGEDRVGVTWVAAGPCVVTQVKTMNRDGYWGLQLGFGEKNIKNVTKSLKGHLKGALKEKRVPRFLREVRLQEEPKLKVGDSVTISDIFSEGDVVTVTGVSKGKGFQGVVKRWRFGGGPRTHGQSDRERAPGSIGLGTTPGRVFKGKKMGGRMGGDTIDVAGLWVVQIDEENGKLAISGALPGSPGSLVVIEKTASAPAKKKTEQAPAAEKDKPAKEGPSKDPEEAK